MLGLLLLLLLAGCLSPGVAGDETGSNQFRSLRQSRKMIKCVLQGSKTFKRFNNYGCYCGRGGQGTPMDELDSCCQTHDNCYGTATKKGCRLFENSRLLLYKYTCSQNTVTCERKNKKCAMFVCECDRNAAICLSKAESKYNNKYKDLDKSRCK